VPRPTVDVWFGAWRLLGSIAVGGNVVVVHWLREGTEFNGWNGVDGSVSVGLACAF
jgi:hypothetical protein